jgi:hypothetical protein
VVGQVDGAQFLVERRRQRQARVDGMSVVGVEFAYACRHSLGTLDSAGREDHHAAPGAFQVLPRYLVCRWVALCPSEQLGEPVGVGRLNLVLEDVKLCPGARTRHDGHE